MTKREKKIVEWCINELLEDGREGCGDFVTAIGRLCELVGWKYQIYELFKKGGIKGTTIDKLSKKESTFRIVHLP